MKGKWQRWLPLIFMALFAVSRWPGLFPSNFSAAYALLFCAGVYFSGRMAWWLPLGTLVLSDIALNFYYQAHGWPAWEWQVLKYQLGNYAAWVSIIVLGRRFKPSSNFGALLGGGILGALLFYFITNTASWLFNPFNNPEYSKTFLGWLIAMIKGTGGWPDTWTFLRNTILSSGLFTAVFVAAMKLTTSAESPQEKVAGVRADETEEESDPEEAKA